ncbi:MAG: LacI family DNA-binding transcriptional regulator, partial [Woeseiaceae bacterium]|nr:LacI family DNA-binding transcriptional regulator [Woeseiaceae bacterium]
MDEIARLSGVSKPTVSRVMNGSKLVAEETRRKVLDVVREKAYCVNQAARRLRQRRTNTIAVVVSLPSLPSNRYEQPFIFDLLAGVFKALNNHRLDGLLVCPEIENPESYEQMIASRVVDGIIFLGQGERPDVLTDLASTNLPFVTWGARDENVNYCTVGSDNPRGGELIGARFAKLGCRHVLFVGWLDGADLEEHRRREGLEEGLLKGAGRNFELNDLQPDGR